MMANNGNQARVVTLEELAARATPLADAADDVLSDADKAPVGSFQS
jgi:hypothetical protein